MTIKDDPKQIVDHLVEQFGVEGALDAVRDGIATAHADENFYRLSIWREVRRVLQERRDETNRK